MRKNTMTRRGFIQGAAGAVAIAGVSNMALGQPEQAAGAVRLGGPIFVNTKDPEELAQAHRQLNYGAAYCPSVELHDKERIKAISVAFSHHGVVIAEVGRWCNMLDADAEKRKVNLEKVTEGLALADEIGARCCVNIAGSFNTDVWYGPHPKNLSREFFDAAVENARTVIDAVKPQRAKFAYEMMGWSLPDSVDSYLELIAAIDRGAFGVHLDPCNLINSPERFYNNTELINDCFDRLGAHIVSCHAKDLHWEIEMNVHFKEVRPGTGGLDYATYLKRLAQLPDTPPLMLEHMDTPEEYDAARRYLLEYGEKLGVVFA